VNAVSVHTLYLFYLTVCTPANQERWNSLSAYHRA